MSALRDEKELRELLAEAGAEIEKTVGKDAVWAVPSHPPSMAPALGPPTWRRIYVRRESSGRVENRDYWRGLIAQVNKATSGRRRPVVDPWTDPQKVLSVTQTRTVLAPQYPMPQKAKGVFVDEAKREVVMKELKEVEDRLLEAASLAEKLRGSVESTLAYANEERAKSAKLREENAALQKRLDLSAAASAKFSGVDVDKLRSENDTLKQKLAESLERLKGFEALRAALKAVS